MPTEIVEWKCSQKILSNLDLVWRALALNIIIIYARSSWSTQMLPIVSNFGSIKFGLRVCNTSFSFG